MGELGELLRETREEKGFTLQDVEDQTRIRAKYIRALEEGTYDELPTPGHVPGFLRNYALFMGLDADEIRAAYAKETSERGLFDPGIFNPKNIDLAPRKSLFSASLVLGLVIAVVVLVIGGWAIWQYGLPNIQPLLRLLTPLASSSLTPTASPSSGEPSIDEPSADGPSTAAPLALAATATEASPTRPNLTRMAATRQRATNTPPPTPTARLTATPTEAPTRTPTPTATRDRPLLLPTPTPLPSETPTLAPTPAEGVVLDILVIERSWLQVTVDEREQPGELLEAGDERTWRGQFAIYFICGNAGGVEVTVNGEELGTLGERGEVVERTWTSEGEVTPTPQTEGTPARLATPTSSQ